MKKHIPNTITLLNLCSGAMGVVAAYEADYKMVVFFILLSAVLDFLDGFMARLLKAYSPLGKELDSLADVISFGLVPAMVAKSLMTASLGWVSWFGLLIAAFSALRLAKFNIDDRQTTSFIGMPTPANAILWGGLAYAYAEFFSANPYITLALVVATSLLLVSSLPMFSLKFRSFSPKENIPQYTLIVVSAILFIVLKLEALAWIITLYILMSIIIAMFCNKTPKES